MSDGRQAALAGTMIGPSRQASHRPVVSVRPAVDRTTSRQRTFSGTPRTVSRMLVPHDVASSRAVACTCEVRLVPDSVTGAAGCPPGCAGGDAPQGPVIKAAAAAREAASPAADPASRARGHRLARRARGQRPARRAPRRRPPGLIRCALPDRAARPAAAGRTDSGWADSGWAAASRRSRGAASGGTMASRPGMGARRITSARHDWQCGRCASTLRRSSCSAAPST